MGASYTIQITLTGPDAYLYRGTQAHYALAHLAHASLSLRVT